MTEVYTNDPRIAAADYRERGWSPIPIKARSKAPKLPRDHSFLSRKATDEEFGRFDFRHNVGIVTGRVSGIIVVDDDDDGETLRKNGWHIPATPTTKTRRGHQFYLRYPEDGFPTFDVAGKLEVRGDGAYVVAPPSVHPSGTAYEWVISPDDARLADPPEWLLEQARLKGRRMRAEDIGETIPNGARNKKLFSIAGTLRRRGLDEGSIYAALLGINKAKCETPLDEDEVREIAASIVRYEPAPPRPDPEPPHPQNGKGSHTKGGGFRLTDLGNAERLIARHGDDLRYCHAWHKWLVWDGMRWRVDDSGVVKEWAKETVRAIYGEATAIEDDGKRKALIDHARRSESRQRLEAMISLAESSVPVQAQTLDPDPWLLNFTNGTFDCRSGELREHSRDDLITKITGAPYQPEAKAPRFERFLREVLVEDDLIGFVRRFAGYSLTGSTRERCFAILWGSGKNGKSTLVELLREAAGDYSRNTAADTVLAKRYDGVGNDVAALRGARFVTAAEVEKGRRLAEAKVKNLTGDETITTRFLYGEPFDFRPEFTLWLSTNNKPEVRGTDDAIWDRIRLIPFEQRFVGHAADLTLPEKLRGELPGVLAWMVRGCTEWLRVGLREPDGVLKATRSYRKEMDTLAAFIEDRCVVNQDVRAGGAALFAAYDAWRRDNNEEELSGTMFGRRMGERFHKDTNPTVVYHGIGLRDDRPDPDPDDPDDPDPDGDVEGFAPDNGPNECPEGAEPAPNPLTPSELASNPLNAESPIDKANAAPSPEGDRGFREFIHETELDSSHKGNLSKNPLNPLNPLNPDAVRFKQGLIYEGMAPRLAHEAALEMLARRRAKKGA